MSKVSVFFERADSLLNTLQSKFSEHKNKIEKYKITISTMKTMNGRKFIKEFMNYISQYSEQINNCDESHFLEKNPEDFGATGEGVKIGNLIKEIWPSLDNKTKAVIWWYLQELLKLGNEILNNK